MLRVLSSIAITSALFPIAAWFVHVAKSGFDFATNPLTYHWQLGFFCFIFLLVLGLPWAPFLKKRQILKFFPIVSLAGAVSATPFAAYSLFMLINQLSRSHLYNSLWIQQNVATFIELASTTFAFGVFCGSTIWLLGVYRNQWFQN